MPIPAGPVPVPAATYAVTLDDVKRHGNITGTASDDELMLFIETAQQMVAALVGAIVPAVITERHPARPWTPRLWLRTAPILAVLTVQELNATTAFDTLDDTAWYLDAGTGELVRLAGNGYSHWLGTDVLITYQVGRDPVPAGIRWAIMELTIHLWRSTQAQRGGRGRGDTTDATAAGYGMPNRVRDVLAPFLLAPGIA